MAAEEEQFELELLGGAVGKRWRRQQAALEELPWRSIKRGSAEARLGWTRAALQEHASAAAQAVLVRALVAARAPLDLTGLAARLPQDELAHAELCARVALSLGGASAVTYRREAIFATAPPGDDPRLEATELVVSTLCVSESWSYALLRELQEKHSHPGLRAVWARIYRDEALHARLGWIFLDWLGDPGKGARLRLAQAAARTAEAIRAGGRAAAARPAELFGPSCPLAGLSPETYAQRSERWLERSCLLPLRKRGIPV